MKQKVRGNPIPLIVEDHPEDYNGYPFITLIQHKDEQLLVIIDNADDKSLKAFVLDLCGPERVDEEKILDVAVEWWNERKERYPLSFEFSRQNMTLETSKIYRTFHIEFISRVIGPLPKFEMSEVASVRRRKRKALSPGIAVHDNVHFINS